MKKKKKKRKSIFNRNDKEKLKDVINVLSVINFLNAIIN